MSKPSWPVPDGYEWVKFVKPTPEELLKGGHVWEPWFAWHPVRINGRWVWFKDIYRLLGNTYVDYDNWTWYHYGTMFDVIRTTNGHTNQNTK